MPEEPTTGELYRLIQGLQRDFGEWRKEVKADIQSMSFVHKDVYASDMSAIKEDIKALKDENAIQKEGRRSLMLAALGALILSPIGSILTYLLLNR